MSRSGYSCDCENIGLWQGAVRSALCGKRGQAFLRELAAAMDAMPERKLIAGELVTPEGECCALGVVCKSRGLDAANLDFEDAREVGNFVGISHAMAAEIEYLNDDAVRDATPEARWARMRAWVEEQICG